MHTLPDDLKKALASNSKALKTWEIVTPLARNEWICWVTSGMRRPCCWSGCIHRLVN
ncbi:MAG: YdeI/OmpD-associated family protein [Patescibacteria group bacterium]